MISAHIIFAFGVVFSAVAIQSTFGFGCALVMMPLLTAAAGLKIATPLVAMIATTLHCLILRKDWRKVRIGSAWRLILASAIGIPVGIFLLKGPYDNIMKGVLGVVVTGFSLYKLLQPDMGTLKDERFAWIFGFAAGVLGGAFNTNGPPVVIYGALRKWTPSTFRSTLQGYFLPAGFVILDGHGIQGLWTREIFQLYLYMLPALLAGFLLGNFLHNRLPVHRFDRVLYMLLVLIGLSQLIRLVS